MKKLGLLVLLSIFTIASVMAQGKPSFGFKAGLNFAKVSDSDLDNSTGFHAGLALHVPLVKKSGLQVEAFYSAEGVEDVDLAYVNVPILYAYKIVPGLHLHIGPQFKVKVKTDVSFDGFSAEAEESFEDDIKDFNFDAAVGLEYKFPVVGIFVQARYNFGLTDIGDEFDGKSQVFQLSTGYRF